MVSMSIAFAIQRFSCVNGYMLLIFLLNCNQCPPPDSGSPGPPGRTGPKGENAHKATATTFSIKTLKLGNVFSLSFMKPVGQPRWPLASYSVPFLCSNFHLSVGGIWGLKASISVT